MERNTEKEKLKWKTASRVLKRQKDKCPLCSKFQIELNHFTVHQGDDRERRKEGSLNNLPQCGQGQYRTGQQGLCHFS
ncbi:hypothetical protein NC652_030956 [Populus alba x Populus x berolinensis]|nr:hypothetical protein NC652_030956 [Populus alba x Populus x berolinensis]